MHRRAFLKLGLSLPLWQLVPQLAFAQNSSGFDKTLILLELNGGNDGLNTLVPYASDDYYRARPTLALSGDQLIPLSNELALNYALSPLADLWQQREISFVQGLGYAQPNRSHFRSINIWDTGSGAESYLQNGWIADCLSNAPDSALQALTLGTRNGPLIGEDVGSLMLTNPRLLQMDTQDSLYRETDNHGLQHLIDTHETYFSAVDELQSGIQTIPNLNTDFGNHSIGAAFHLAAQILLSGVRPGVIKLSHGSFDTHQQQLITHQRLLAELAQAVVAFRQTMKDAQLWQEVTVASYSEFGRRVEENGSRGTDHGAAAVQFVAGGSVSSGILGDVPDLQRLDDNGDLPFQLDFRRYYRSLQDWAGWPLSARLTDFTPLTLF